MSIGLEACIGKALHTGAPLRSFWLPPVCPFRVFFTPFLWFSPLQPGFLRLAVLAPARPPGAGQVFRVGRSPRGSDLRKASLGTR